MGGKALLRQNGGIFFVFLVFFTKNICIFGTDSDIVRVGGLGISSLPPRLSPPFLMVLCGNRQSCSLTGGRSEAKAAF